MSATNYRKMVTTNNDTRFIGIECSDGERVTLMISNMTGYAPWLNIEELNDLIIALSAALEVMVNART